MKQHLLALTLMGALVATAPAALNFNLTVNSGVVPSTGGTVTLIGSLSNLTADVALSDVSFSTPTGMTLALDPAFLTYLASNTTDSYGVGNIATVTVAPGLAAGTYASQIAVADASLPGFTDAEAYVVQVRPVPEPASLAVMSIGALGLVRLRRRKG